MHFKLKNSILYLDSFEVDFHFNVCSLLTHVYVKYQFSLYAAIPYNRYHLTIENHRTEIFNILLFLRLIYFWKQIFTYEKLTTKSYSGVFYIWAYNFFPHFELLNGLMCRIFHKHIKSCILFWSRSYWLIKILCELTISQLSEKVFKQGLNPRPLV